MKRNILTVMFSVLLVLSVGFFSGAAEYPKRDIKVIVPWGPGGGSDLDTRLICKYMSEYLGVSMVVVNMPGAGAVIGIKSLMNSPPDGYTIGSGIAALNLTFYPKFVKDAGVALGSITPLFKYDLVPLVIVVRSDAPWKTFGDFLADAKKQPDHFKHGSYGEVSLSHIAMAMVNHYVGTKTKHIPFKSSGETLTALMGGHVDIVAATGLGGGLLEAGKIRPLAVVSSARIHLLPDVPTLKELGYPVVVDIEHGMFCSNKTPKEIQDKLTQAGKRAFEEHGEQIKKDLAGIQLIADWAGQESYKKIVADSETTYDYLIKTLNLRTYQAK
jgi:tripartite-type tricarboxylate transporter receptor subunit TctC